MQTTLVGFLMLILLFDYSLSLLFCVKFLHWWELSHCLWRPWQFCPFLVEVERPVQVVLTLDQIQPVDALSMSLILMCKCHSLDQDIDPLASVHYTDMKPLVNSYIQKLVQIKWDVAVYGRDLYLVKPTLGPPKKFQHLTRAEEVVITRLRIGHTKATKSHILSRGPPTGCHHCGQTLTIDHMLLECALLQECRDEYYTVDSLNALFETIPETCIVEFLREAGFFYLIWCNSLTSTSPQTWTIWSDLSNCLENESKSETHLLV